MPGYTLIACESGIDNRSAPISAPKGSLAVCYNFEKDQGPGLVKRQGTARYDGRVQGPENDAALMLNFAPGALTGVFQYAEQVLVTPTGMSPFQAIVIGFNPAFGFSPCLILAYPTVSFTRAVDVTSLPNATVVQGLVSGALLTAVTGARLMNDSALTVFQYDGGKTLIQFQHAASVKAVPGRNESPLDATFTYADKSYAIHDCVIFSFTNGNSPTVLPLEGHCIRANVSGNFMGRILQINNGPGDWTTTNGTGMFVVYDYPLGQAFPAAADRLDLYDATNTTLLVAQFCRFGANNPTAAPPLQTRALLYSTYEQFVKTYANTLSSPIQSQYAPPTWSRVPLGRELPYTCIGGATTIGFGPVGGNNYSVYEYTRTGLTQQLGAQSPITKPEIGPQIAAESNPSPHWTNVNNIKIQDGNTATYVNLGTNGNVTDFLIGAGFDFSDIPPGSIILGIAFRMRWQESATANLYVDETVQLVGNAFPNGQSVSYAQQQGGQIALTDFTYGGSGDTWGAQNLTLANLQDASFGVQVRFKRITSAGGASLIGVDFFGLTVTYATPNRSVYIRDPAAVTVTDVIANVIDYQIDSGDFLTSTAVGVLTVKIGATEAAGTSAGKTRRIGKGNEIRDAPSTGANVPHGNLLAYTAGEDYPISFPPSAALDAQQPPSRYEVIDANFWDLPDARAAFLVNGVEFAVQFDGTYFIRIHTGRVPTQDKPRHVAVHGSPTPYLCLGFQAGTLSNTGAGHPTHYIGSPDPATFVFGEPITGMLSLNGTTLGVWTDRATRALQGNAIPVSKPSLISPAINCIEYTLVNLVGEAVWCSYRGVETIRTVNAYGDFETLPLSAAAQLWLQPRIQVDSRIGSRPSRALYAIGVRNKRQYRIFFEDGYYFTLTLFDAGDLPVCTTGRLIRPNAFSQAEGNVSYPANNEPWNSGVIRHVHNGTRSDGKELILACYENQNTTFVPASNGSDQLGPYFPYAMRLDCGYADDVMPSIPCFLEFNAFYAASPAQEQQWGTMEIYLQSYGGAQVTVYSRVDFDAPIIDTANNSPIRTTPAPGGVQKQLVNLPVDNAETRAFIPIPNRHMACGINGEGRSCRIRIDATQVSGQNLVVVPMRITHLNFTSVPEAAPEA